MPIPGEYATEEDWGEPAPTDADGSDATFKSTTYGSIPEAPAHDVASSQRTTPATSHLD